MGAAMTRRQVVRNRTPRSKRRARTVIETQYGVLGGVGFIGGTAPWPRDGEPNRQLAFYLLAAPNFLARVETTRAINHFNEQWTARKRLAETIRKQLEAERHG